MTVILQSPWPYAERILLFGGGGVGKTEAIVNTALHTTGHFYVIEADLSAPYMRALSVEQYQECADRFTVHPAADWPDFTSAMDAIMSAHPDPDVDWICIDSSSPNTYNWVQDWTLEQMYGDDMAKMLMELRRTTPDSKEFFAAKSDLMQWDIVKREYQKFWRFIQRWSGNMILTAEAKKIGNRDLDKDADAKRLYGPLGFYPSGQDTIRHAMSTTLMLDHPNIGEWRLTTIKDRQREEQDKLSIDEFAIDYLMGVAGWERVKKA